MNKIMQLDFKTLFFTLFLPVSEIDWGNGGEGRQVIVQFKVYLFITRQTAILHCSLLFIVLKPLAVKKEIIWPKNQDG